MATTTQISSPVSAPGRTSPVVLPGLGAAVAAALVTLAAAAVLKALGADYQLPDGGEAIPLSGFAVVVFGFTLVGVALAAALRRWSAAPRTRFVQVTVLLTALSLVPPFLQDANAGTVASLVALHLIAAAVAIPLIARRLPY